MCPHNGEHEFIGSVDGCDYEDIDCPKCMPVNKKTLEELLSNCPD